MLPISSNYVKGNCYLKVVDLSVAKEYNIFEKETYMANINKQVGQKIRGYREKKKWTQEQLALEANLHRAYIGQIERGEKNIGLINLKKIAKTLNISVKRLF